ncbi:small multidrug resistance protein [Fadolivirus algeromassiliense]|jgi:multidrug transporter EmrE-like cation transporter|uniref:Small multidrug resistance protein n=1 Tax=Fadolivirus FV1/VV64 TaxID=3070911 RepID=A0A7D3V5W8_9VIRU|nr:small multidrug resistance protein [Fadolivirus algeromassiliense]QKF94615.1 small multidrug resistance protein [Fadolivirus FV1/VV64]
MQRFDKLIFFIIMIVIFETIAIACVKEYHDNHKLRYFILAIALYSFICYLLHQSFYYSSMGITNVIWSGLSVFLVTLAGVFFFRETIHWHDIFAGILITAGVIILRSTR